MQIAADVKSRKPFDRDTDSLLLFPRCSLITNVRICITMRTKGPVREPVEWAQRSQVVARGSMQMNFNWLTNRHYDNHQLRQN